MQILFARGPDKQPRKRPIRRIRQAIGDGTGLAWNTALEGIGYGGALATAGLIAKPNDTMLQRKLAIAGLAGGSVYGAYQGIKALRKKQAERRMTVAMQ